MIKKLVLAGMFILSLGLKAQTALNTPVTSSQTVEDPISISLQTGFSASTVTNPNLNFIARINPSAQAGGAQNCGKYGKVVISEIYFDTHYNEDILSKYHFFGEYIELFNSSNVPIDLTGWVIKDNHTEFTLLADNVNNDFIIPPGGHKIVTYGGFKYYGAWSSATPDITAGGAPSAIGGKAKFEELFPEVLATSGYSSSGSILLQNTMVLYNQSDKVSLYAPSGKLVDQVAYSVDENRNLSAGYDHNTESYVGYFDYNYDGGVFNGPMGGVADKDANGNYILDSNGQRIYSFIEDTFRKAIYRSSVDSYYSGGATTFAIATTTPGSSPQLTIPLLPIDPYMMSMGANPDDDNNTEVLVYDIKTKNVVGHSKTYFDDLGKPRVTMSKDFQTNLTWGSETVYDDFGRQWKQSFPAPTCMDVNKNIKFLSVPTYKTQFLDKFYSDNNTYEAYQDKAEQPYSEINYDNSLNTDNVLNTVGGNKIDNEWKTGFSLVVPAVQEMYYAFGSGHFYDNRDINYYIDTVTGDKTYPDYNNMGLTTYRIKVVASDSDLVPYPYSNYPTNEYFDMKANAPLETGKVYKVLRYGATTYVQILEQPGEFRNLPNVWPSMKILEGSWKNFQEVNAYNSGLTTIQEVQTVLNDSNKMIAGLKAVKSVVVDANGIENVSFVDSDGKLLASARSGGALQYPVTSLIGSDGYVDIHLPKGCDGTLSYIGGEALYKVYDLRKSSLLTDAEKANLTAGFYRIQLINGFSASNLISIDKTTGAINPVATNSKGVNYKVNYYDYSMNIYNKIGQLVKNVQPNGYEANAVIKLVPQHMNSTATAFVTTNLYNGQGQLKESVNTDRGMIKLAYRKDGKIRYSQSQIQADSKVSYSNYDELSRAIESGVVSGATGIWAQAFANPDGSLVTGTCSEQIGTIYDYPGNNQTSIIIPANLTLGNVLAAESINTANYLQENLYGNVVSTFSKTGTSIDAVTWYNYDAYGRVVWLVQYNEGLGAKTIHYEYDYKGNITKVIFQKDKSSELFIHRYVYNAINGALVKVETSTDNVTYITHADYEYYVAGQLKRTNIGQGVQGLDYVYNLAGKLKSINHPSLEQAKDPGHDANDIFGITLDYHNGDYQRANTNIASSPTIAGANQDFNGNIKAARWANKNDVVGGLANQRAYTYNYDRNDWLTTATFGSTNNTGVITNSNSFSEGTLTYDANGNIQTLKRTNETGALVDNLSYEYTYAGTNRLNRVADAVGSATVTYDIDSQSADNYVYDDNGQLILNDYEDLEYFYNVQGLTTEVKKRGITRVKFYYNERGQRIKKESFDSFGVLLSTDFYVLDFSGSTIAVYTKPATGNAVQNELPIYGLERLGVYVKDLSGDFMKYEITDHLGNVRALAQKKVNSTSYLYADYYPYGEKLPTRDNVTGAYRYAYQGQELDAETGMEAFELRLWDGRLGRWLNPDPNEQYDSPYMGMGNNPVSFIDPDGGFDGDPGKGSWWSRMWGNVKSVFSSNDEKVIQLDEVRIERKHLANLKKLGEDSRGAVIYSFPNSLNRMWYTAATYRLKFKYGRDRFNQKGLDARFKIKTLSRRLTLGPTRGVLNKIAPVVAKKAPATFWKVDKGVTGLGAVGTGLSALAVYNSTNNIIHAKNKPRQVAIEASGWVGAAVGAEIGAPVALAVAPWTGPFAPVTGVVIVGIFSAAGSAGFINIAEATIDE